MQIRYISIFLCFTRVKDISETMLQYPAVLPEIWDSAHINFGQHVAWSSAVSSSFWLKETAKIHATFNKDQFWLATWNVNKKKNI